MRIAAADARFSVPVAKLGALYLRSDLHRLAATIGVGRCKKLIYSSTIVGAEQVLVIGLVDEVVSEEQFEAALGAFVDIMVERSSFTLQRSKQMLRAAGHGGGVRETGESLAAFAEAMQAGE